MTAERKFTAKCIVKDAEVRLIYEAATDNLTHPWDIAFPPARYDEAPGLIGYAIKKRD